MLDRPYQLGRNRSKQHQNGGNWWSRRCAGRRRQQDVQRLSPLAKQGQWMGSEGVEIKYQLERSTGNGSKQCLIIRATYDALPSPKNLHQWFSKIQPVSFAQLQQLSKSRQAVRPTSRPLYLAAHSGQQGNQLFGHKRNKSPEGNTIRPRRTEMA